MRKVVAFKVLLVALFCLLLLGFSYRIYQENYSKLAFQIRESLSLEAKAHADVINARLDDLKGDLSILRGAPPIQGIQRALYNNNRDPHDSSTTAVWQSRLRSVLESYLQSKPNISKVRYVAIRDGWNELVSVEREQSSPFVLSFEMQQQFVENISASDSNGVFVSRLMKTVKGKRSNLLLLGAKVFDSDGALFGVLLIDVEVDAVLAQMVASISPSLGLYVLSSRSGLMFSEVGLPQQNNSWFDDIVDHITSSIFTRGRASVVLNDSDYLSIVLIKDDHDARCHALMDALTLAVAVCAAALISMLIVILQRRNSQQQASLIINESKNAAIIKSSQDAIIGTNREGVINSWNASAEKMFGYLPHEAIGKRSIDLMWSPRHLEEEAEIHQKLLNGQLIKPYETIRRHKNGQDITVFLSASVIRNERNVVIGISEIIRDMTELKAIAKELSELNKTLQIQVEERTRELKQSYSLQEAIFTTGENLIIATDTSGVITHFNPAAENLLGYSKEEVVGKCTPIIFHDQEEVVVRAKELSNELNMPVSGFDVFVIKTRLGLKNDHEWTYITRQGDRVPVYLSASAFYNEQGDITGYLGMIANISDLIHQQQQLVAFKDQLTKASEIAHLGIWSWGLADNSIYWNPEMYGIYDMDISEPVQLENWVAMVVEEDRQRALDHFQMLIDSGSEADIIFDVITGAGNRKTIHATASLEKSSYQNGRVTVIGINQDISQRIGYENALKEAKNAADLSNRIKSEFVANMSHEIRTPLNAVIGTLELMRRTELNEMQKAYIERSDKAAKSLLAILNDILDFSKIEAGRLEVDPQPFCLIDFVDDLTQILKAYKAGKDIELIVDIDPALPAEMTLDSLRLQQVILNLVGNALKFTAQGEVVLRFKATDHQLLMIEIIDTGIGIEQAKQERLFNAFTQAQASTVREYGGTGLGLVISKRLVELMEGSMTFHSELGKGTEFYLSIPFQSESLTSLHLPSISSNSAVILDSNSASRVATLHAVEMLGWDAVLAADVEAFWAQLQRKADFGCSVDMILIDQAFMHGLDLSKMSINKRLGKALFNGKIVILSREEYSVGHLGSDIFNVSKPITAKSLAQLCAENFSKQEETVSVKENQLPLNGLKLLLAEDNLTNQLIAKELLKSEGAEVVIANNGQEAVERFQRETFDLVLMDIQMPVMDGYDAAKAIRVLSESIPIIAMTANALASDRALAEAAGMNAHIGKPFQIEQLVDMILQSVQDDALHAKHLVLSEHQSTSGRLQTINQTHALTRMGGNHGLYRTILEAFVRESLELMNQLPCQSMKLDGDRSGVIRSAHSLKGSAGAVGAEQLADAAKQLESQLKSGDLTGYQESRVHIETLYQEAIVAIRAILNQSKTDVSEHSCGSNLATCESMDQLIELLESSNMRAMSVYESMLAQAGPDTIAILEKVQSAMQALDFKAVAKELNNYVQGLK